MNDIEFIKSCFKKLWGDSSKGEYLVSNDMTIIRSGYGSRETNVCFYDKVSDFNIQKEVFNQEFNVNGMIFASPSSRFLFNNISNRVTYYGRVGVLKSSGYTGSVSPGKFDIVKMNEDNAKDYVYFITNARKIEREPVVDMVKRNYDNLLVYMAYDGDTVIGAGSAISNEGKVFIFDTIVTEKARNGGALSSIGERSMQEATKDGIKEFYSIVSSAYSHSVAAKMGFEEKLLLDFWESGVA